MKRRKTKLYQLSSRQALRHNNYSTHRMKNVLYQNRAVSITKYCSILDVLILQRLRKPYRSILGNLSRFLGFV